MAFAGLLPLLPRGQGPPDLVRKAVAPYVPPRSTLAIMRANHPGRFLALVVGSDGHQHAVAKVATEDSGKVSLEKEARNIESYGCLLESPLRAPRILAQAPGLLLLEAERWMARARPWVLPPKVAYRLGRAYTRSSRNADGGGLAHGDCAPWNLLKTEDGWVLVDWEEARDDRPPFFDLFHYLVQAHVLLGRPSRQELLGLYPGRSSRVRVAIEAYSAGAGLPVSVWRRHLVDYLAVSKAELDPLDPEQATGVAARERLLDILNG